MIRISRVTLILTCVLGCLGLQLDVGSAASIKITSQTLAKGLMDFYHGDEPGQVLGKFPYPPYYWWMSGAAWGAMIDYWALTGDSQWNSVVTKALLAQVGPR